MSAYMIATIAVKKPAKFQAYLMETQKVAAPYGAKLMFRGKTERSLAGGTADHGVVVVVEFPNQEKIDAWYASDAYQPLVPLRDAAAEMTMISYSQLG